MPNGLRDAAISLPQSNGQTPTRGRPHAEPDGLHDLGSSGFVCGDFEVETHDLSPRDAVWTAAESYFVRYWDETDGEVTDAPLMPCSSLGRHQTRAASMIP